jgi:hypothetical protein
MIKEKINRNQNGGRPRLIIAKGKKKLTCVANVEVEGLERF